MTEKSKFLLCPDCQTQNICGAADSCVEEFIGGRLRCMKQQVESAQSQARTRHWGAWAWGFLLGAAFVLLAGCGGGEPEPEERGADHIPFDCAQNPLACK